MRNALAAAAFVLFSQQASAGGLEDFLNNLNIQARANMNGFSAKVSSQFKVGDTQVKVVLGSVQDPADAFMVFQLGKMTGKAPEEVLRA